MQTTSLSLGWKLTPQTELLVPGVTVLHEVITCTKNSFATLHKKYCSGYARIVSSLYQLDLKFQFRISFIHVTPFICCCIGPFEFFYPPSLSPRRSRQAGGLASPPGPAGISSRGRMQARQPGCWCRIQNWDGRDHLQCTELCASQQLHSFPLFQVIDHLWTNFLSSVLSWMRITSRGLSPLPMFNFHFFFIFYFQFFYFQFSIFNF